MARIHAVQAIFLLKCALYPYEPAVPSTSDSQRNLEGTVSKCVYSERQRRAVHNFLFIYLLDCMSETDSRPSCHSTLDVRLVSARVDTAMVCNLCVRVAGLVPAAAPKGVEEPQV